VVADAEVNEANQTTLGTERRSVVKKSLTGPTLLEMSGNATDQDLPMRVAFQDNWCSTVAVSRAMRINDAITKTTVTKIKPTRA